MTNLTSGNGRHRAVRRLTIAQRLGAVAVLLGAGGFTAAMWPASAAADAPIQTAWFSAAPSPTTPAGGLHVEASSSQIVAFSAVMYSLAEGSTATLEFKVSHLAATPVINPTAPSTTPAVNIVACPIIGTWKSGDDQPMATAPKSDCTHAIPGSLSADQTTLTFLADSNLESTPGSLSLAILPVLTDEIPGVGTPAPADTTQPFSLDLDKPDSASLTVTSTTAPPPPPTLSKGSATGTTTTGSSSPANSSAASGSGSSVSLPSTLTGNQSTATDAGSSPVVAPQSGTPAAAPAAAVAPSKNDRGHNAALAMLLLIGIGLVAMGNGQLQRAPRLLGGSGRHAAGAAGAAAAATAAAPVMMTPYGNRGLGRFAKARTEPARPLT